MKLVSPKTLLASLLGCTFVVMKVMTFDGAGGYVLDHIDRIPDR